MISVCIPVYNTDVRELAGSLREQAADISAEIILIDDGSADKYRELNRSLQQEGFRYYELEKNIGRSRVRNRFTEYATQRHLLFLDCDSVILSDAFLAGYVMAIEEHSNRIICGGRIYDPKPPERRRRLHWKYGIRKESQPVLVREQDPNRSFMTNNFLIPATILKDIPFDKRLFGYGHEDSLFGFELARRGHEIIHIDNPVLHGQLETNREFISKTETAVTNLIFITTQIQTSPEFAGTITLLRTVRRIDAPGTIALIRFFHKLFRPLLRWCLINGMFSLKLLDIYKLGTYLQKTSKSAMQIE
jgi:glycosyltransferase involved in cell wall biosynthesis